MRHAILELSRKNQHVTPHKYDVRHYPFAEFREDCLVCELARPCRAGGLRRSWLQSYFLS